MPNLIGCHPGERGSQLPETSALVEGWSEVYLLVLKMALYCLQGSGTPRQQLLMMHSIEWYCTVLHGIEWYCIVMHGIALYCMVLHGIV